MKNEAKESSVIRAESRDTAASADVSVGGVAKKQRSVALPWRLARINGKTPCLVNANGGRITYVDDDSLMQIGQGLYRINNWDALKEVAEDVLLMLEACGYGGSNAGTANRHVKRLRAAIFAATTENAAATPPTARIPASSSEV